MKIFKAAIILVVLNMAVASCETNLIDGSAMAQTIELPSSN